MRLGTVLNLNQGSGAVPFPCTKVMWVIGPNYTQHISLAVRERRTGAPLWFQLPPSNAMPTSNRDADSTDTMHALRRHGVPNRGNTVNSRDE